MCSPTKNLPSVVLHAGSGSTSQGLKTTIQRCRGSPSNVRMSDGKIAADLFIYAVVSVVPHHGCRPKTQASSEADSLKIETYTWKHRYQDQATTFAVRCNQNNMAYDMARKHGKKAWQRCKKSSDLGSRRVSGIRTREFRPGTPSIGDTKKAEQSLFGRLLAGGGDSPISTDDELKALATSINARIDQLAIYTQRKPPDWKVVLPSLLEDSGISKEAMCHVLWKLNTESYLRWKIWKLVAMMCWVSKSMSRCLPLPYEQRNETQEVDALRGKLEIAAEVCKRMISGYTSINSKDLCHHSRPRICWHNNTVLTMSYWSTVEPN